MCCIDMSIANNSTNSNTGTCKGTFTGMRRWGKADLNLYYNKTRDLLYKIQAPFDLLHSKCDVFRCTHWSCINSFYNAIVNSLIVAMNGRVPALRKGSLKPFWSQNYRSLRRPLLTLIKCGIYVADQEMGC